MRHVTEYFALEPGVGCCRLDSQIHVGSLNSKKAFIVRTLMLIYFATMKTPF